MKKPAYSVAIVGATGLVGGEILSVLEQRQFPVADLQLYASAQSAGDLLRCGAITTRVALLETARFADTDIVFFATGERLTAEWVARATAAGAVVIDTSQLYADDPDVPVVVPEVNAAALMDYAERMMVCSPDAPAVGLAMVLEPLHTLRPLLRVVVTTFEPVSGRGRAGINELQQQSVDLMSGRSTAEHEVFARRIAFNVVPHVGEFLAGGMSGDEARTVSAVRRLLDAPDLGISVTRVRTPIFYGTGMTVNIETIETWSAPEAREVLAAAPGVLVQDDLAAMEYPTPADVVGQDAVCVGRIRDQPARNVLDLWLVMDTFRKGSALNAVQIAELLIRDYL